MGENGSLGNAARTTLFGPGRWNADAAVSKRFGGFQFRAEIFNVFNKAQFNNPSLDLNNSRAFGVITGQANAPRQLQLGVKLLW